MILLHCISSYPTPIEQAHLRQIPGLAKRFKVPVGLSDHTLGTTVSVTSVALGACVIEKHFTLKRANKGPDCEFSLEPAEFKRLCREVKEAWMALGDGCFNRQKAQEGSKVFRRSLYIIKDVKAGDILTHKNVRRIRPGNGLLPKHLSEIIGKKFCRNTLRGTPLTYNLIKKPHRER